MTTEYEIQQYEEAIDAMQEIIASMEIDIELMKLEIVHRGNTISRLESQNRVLKNQLVKKLQDDSRIPALLKPKEENGKEC